MDEKYHDQICGLCGNFDGKLNDLTLKGKMVFSNVKRMTGIKGSPAPPVSENQYSGIEVREKCVEK